MKDPVEPAVCVSLAACYDRLRWKVASAPNEKRDLKRTVELGRRAVALAPNESWYLMTLGATLYRAGRPAESIEVLSAAWRPATGRSMASTYFFWPAYHRLGAKRPGASGPGRPLDQPADHPRPR